MDHPGCDRDAADQESTGQEATDQESTDQESTDQEVTGRDVSDRADHALGNREIPGNQELAGSLPLPVDNRSSIPQRRWPVERHRQLGVAALPWIKRVVFLLVLVGLIVAGVQSTQRWHAETARLSAEIASLQQQAAGEADPVRRSAMQAEADSRIAAIPSLGTVRWDRVGWAAFLYGLGLLPPGWILHRCFLAMQVPSTWRRATDAQLIGHAGKYIPGKALVVVLRVGAILPKGVPAAQGSPAPHRPVGRATTCVFLETLLMMGVGGFIAGALLWNSPLPVWVRAMAALMAVGSMVPLCPPVMRCVVALVQRRRAERVKSSSDLSQSIGDPPAVSPTASVQGITWSLLAVCCLASLLSWAFIGASFACLVSAIPSWHAFSDVGVGIEAASGAGVVAAADTDWIELLSWTATATAAISLGMVLGFASLLPGGAGVREFVTLLVLTPVVGPTHALLSVIAARLMFIIVEAILAGVAWLDLRRFSAKAL
ncbi:lysylphosphatidylglycerol synthase transmembrane domain-containing protein [Neorhodopirellula lusitana]|uniref:lysylphosphatidylglycerol synthase transmembrane domain-containing protein n=1 Tax=Neorhodopirellula lusitana TaxID=445327 RepID=UPI00384D3D60